MKRVDLISKSWEKKAAEIIFKAGMEVKGMSVIKPEDLDALEKGEK